MQVATTICNFLTFHWRVMVLCIFVLSYLHNTYVKNIIQNNISYILYCIMQGNLYNQWPKFPALKKSIFIFLSWDTYLLCSQKRKIIFTKWNPSTHNHIHTKEPILWCGKVLYVRHHWSLNRKKKKTHFLGGSIIITSWLVLFLKVHYSS